MVKIKCLKCGSVGYSASIKTACECGGSCRETINKDERDIIKHIKECPEHCR